MAEVTKIKPVAENGARVRLPAPRPLTQLASSRYSNFVGAMKVVLPAIAVGLILLVVGWPQFQSREQGFRIGIANITLEDAADLRMMYPRYQGIDRQGEPFTVTARSAVKHKPASDVIELEMPQADITLNKGNWVALKAEFGAYREQDQQLDLIGSVNLYHDEGYEFRTISAHVNMTTNSAEGDDPVHGQGPFGEITSQGFRIYDKGKRIVFTGQAHLLLQPQATTGAVHE